MVFLVILSTHVGVSGIGYRYAPVEGEGWEIRPKCTSYPGMGVCVEAGIIKNYFSSFLKVCGYPRSLSRLPGLGIIIF